ncbi:MAG TPA: alpha/beta hydrolase [Longimicrobiales bacterium]|nr:alpha/beta hydrolase [Longimicrobiales bacterium]
MTWLIALLALYVVWIVVVFLTQRAVVFPGQALPVPAEAAPGPRVERWWLEVGGGEVEAWYHPPSVAGDDAPAPALVFGHGNGERIDDWAGAFRPLAERGVAVLLVEYPGYGRSAGSPCQASVTRTMVAAFDRLSARPEVDGTRIVGMGRSLGGGAICALARQRPLRALLLQSTFTSVRAFAGRFLVPPFVVRDAFDNLAVVRDFDGPVLVAHGTGDAVIPYRHGRRLASSTARATLLTYRCGHNDCPPDWRVYLGEVSDFLRENGVLRSGEGM